MSHRLPRTSISLDSATLETIDALAKLWAVSKAEALRNPSLEGESEQESRTPPPVQAFDRLQGDGGLSVKEVGCL